MRVDGTTMTAKPEDMPAAARELEELGYDGVFTAETSHDPFLPITLAALETERIELGTGIAVAFARNPMTMATIGNDLQLYTKGRFILGLGSQIKPHIEKRFSMPWSHPADRMREFILAMRAIWASWSDGGKLDFRGDFYRHTLMTPFFNPGPNPYGNPKVFLAAVGERMTERYVREITLPALERGWAKAGKERSQFELSGPMFVVTGTNEEEYENARRGTKQQIAFYGSTPAYRGVLELHGWGDLQGELNRLSKQGEWVQMGDLVDDEMLATFAVTGEPEEIPGKLLARYGDIVDRVSFYAPYKSDPERWARVVGGFKTGG
jgi:probable F420-dependent oxidoreductase